MEFEPVDAAALAVQLVLNGLTDVGVIHLTQH